jgi:hypothetical protein
MILLLAVAALALFAVAGAGAGSDPWPGKPEEFPLDEVKRLSELPDPASKNRAGEPATAKKYPISPSLVPGLDKKYAKFRPMGWMCWYTTIQHSGLRTSWGSWPFHQVVIEERYWCGYAEGGAITYLWFTVHTDSYLYEPSNGWAATWGGGPGYNHALVLTFSHFYYRSSYCPWCFHYDRWQVWSCDTYTWTPCVKTQDSGYL